MSVTIDKQTPTHTMVYNPGWWVVHSTNSGQTNFRFIMDIYITGQTFAGQSYVRLATPIDPATNRGVFNPHPILERYLSYDINIASSGAEAIKQGTNSVIEYALHFGEQYGPSSAVVSYPDLANTGNRYAYNGVIDHLDYVDFINTSGSAFLNAATTAKRFLTNSPKTRYVRSNEHEWLHIINNSGTQPSARAYYQSFDNNSALIASLEIANNYSALSNVADHRIIIPVGYNINDIVTGDIVSGALPFITGSVARWAVYMRDTFGNQTSEIFTFKKDSSCTDYTEYRVHFFNELGGFDSFTFTQGSKFETDIKTKKFSKPAGRFISLSNYMYDDPDELDISFYTELKDTLTLNSGWIDESYAFWLEELETSPHVFIENVTFSRFQSTISLMAVTVADVKYQRKKIREDRLFNLQIKVKPTYNRYRQRA